MLLKIIICFLLIFSISSEVYAAKYTSKFDLYFKRSTENYFPLFDFRHFKAQAMQESRLDPSATSKIKTKHGWIEGASGLMQLMKPTAADLGLTTKDMRYDPEMNIDAGIRYMKQMWDFWYNRDSLMSYADRMRIARASYNAGAGNLQKAWRLSLSSHSWKSVEQKLPQITGERSQETLSYVPRIEKFYHDMSGLDEEKVLNNYR